MPRGLTILTACSLLVGLAVAVAVAWYFAAYSSRPRVGGGVWTVTETLGDREDHAFLAAHPDYLGTAIVIKDSDELGYSLRFYRPPDVESDNPAIAAKFAAIPKITLTRVGWPWLALQCEEANHQYTPETAVLSGGFWVARPRTETWGHPDPRRPIPFRPIWSGLCLDALLFSSPLLLALAITAFARTAHRRRIGRCPKCGYPRGSSQVCPECGVALAVPPNERCS